MTTEESQRCDITGLEDEMWKASQNWKSKETDFPPEPRERNTTLPTL